MRSTLGLVVAVVLGGLVACFTGEGTIGGVCHDAADCGGQQGCSHEICGLCGDGRAQVGEVCFADGDDRVIGASPPTIAVTDLDDDGRLDLVAIEPGGSSLHVLRGSAAGRFDPPVTVAIGARATDVAVGDLDLDGARDVAVSTVEPPGLVVLWGDGTAMLMPAEPVMVGSAPGSLAIDDMRTDVLPRVAVGDPGTDPMQPGRVVVLERPQPRAFVVGPGADVGASVEVVAAAFADDDEIVDWVVLHDAGVEVLHGDAAGGLVRDAPMPVGSTPTAAWTGDLDADGDLDIVVTVTDDDALVVLWGATDGFDVEVVPTGPEPLDVAVVDVNRDSALDLVVAAGSEPGLVLHPAWGRSYPHHVTLFEAAGRHQVIAADFDDDLLPDLVTAARDVAAITIFVADP